MVNNLFKPKKVGLLVFILVIGFAGSLLYHYSQGYYFNQKYPSNTFLFNPGDRFADFTYWFEYSKGLNPYLGGAPTTLRNLFPLFYLLGNYYSLLDYNTALTILLAGFMIFLVAVTYKKIKTGNQFQDLTNTLILTVFSYPVLFVVDRGNLELAVFILVVLTVFTFSKKKYALSAVLLGLTTALKLFPAIYILLFLRERKFREFFLGLFLAVFFLVAPLFLFQGGFSDNFNRFLENLNLYKQHYVIEDAGYYFSSSLWGLFKFGYNKFRLSTYLDKPMLYQIYLGVAGIITAAVSWLVIFWENIFWKRVAMITIVMCLLPFVSADYKLLHMYVPLFLLLESKEKSKLDYLYLVLFALILIPKSYYILKNPDLGIGVIINPVLLFILLGLIIGENLYLRLNTAKAK